MEGGEGGRGGDGGDGCKSIDGDRDKEHIPIDLSRDSAFLELHNILCESSSFVREDVFHLR